MDALIIPLAALAIPIIVVPVAIGCRYAQRTREMEHSERMRALELGLTHPKDEPWWSPARITAGIGVMVPLAALGIAWLSTESLGSHGAETIQMICGLVGFSSVLSGGLLARKYMDLRHPAANHRQFAATSKPAFDPDAYDVVGSRG